MEPRFENCDPQRLATLLETEMTVSPATALTEGPGSRIGRYKLLQLIGEGGFGSVFMAEQETPVVRKVAMKIIKLGMDTKQVIARFEAERQALAMMDHPNIAKVLDAGSTGTGRPFFVMELVRGVPITDFCDESKLTTRQRLELFIPVCAAVQHAHQKGIIHRDLKPNNVLVTMHDDKPVPMVIDFGVAKATQGRLTEKTLFTEFRQFIGTPQYMSPEQAQMNALDIDTRGDIYSLGVLLYELLTGTTPFDPQELRSAAHEEMRRIIREVEPPLPSTRVSTLAAAALSTAADHRRCDAGTLSRTLKGELDWIIMKCLEKDRSRRYETANGLARDVQRHLNDEPIEASPPSATYRLRKLVRRHRRQAVALVTIAATLFLGIIGTSVGLAQARRNLTAAREAEKRLRTERDVADVNAVRANDAERREAAQRKQAEAVAAVLESIFQRLDPYAEEKGRPDLRTRLVGELDKIASTLDTEREWEQIRHVLEGEVAAQSIEIGRLPAPDARRPSMLLDRAKRYMRLGEFEKAIADLSLIPPTEFDTAPPWQYIGAAMAYCGRVDAYRSVCRNMLERFRGSRDAFALDQTAKTCLLREENTNGDPKQMIALAERAIANAASPDARAWFCLTDALARYRMGDWGGCVHWAGAASSGPDQPVRTPTADLVTAMAYAQQGQTKQPRDLYHRAQERIDREYPHATAGGTGGGDPDWLAYQVLRREAEALINGKGPTTKQVAQKQPVAVE